MTKGQAKKVAEYFNRGYIVHIISGYTDSWINDIDTDEDGRLAFSSDVFDMEPLEEHSIGDVVIALPIKVLDLNAYASNIGDIGDYSLSDISE